MKDKSQSSVELTVILGIMLIALSIFLVVNTDISSTSQNSFTKNSIKNSLQDIISSSEFVYSQGIGASKDIVVRLPNSVANSSIEDKTLTFFLYPSGTLTSQIPIYDISSVDIQGTLPTKGGTYTIKVESLGGFVNVSFS